MEHDPADDGRPTGPPAHRSRRAGWWIAGVGLTCAVLAVVGLPAHATYGARTTADEPQYLLSATSLAEDRDLDISDEIRDARYRPYHELRIDQQTVILDGSGRRVSPHDPLLPALLAGPVALGGWVAAKATLAALAGATAALTTALAIRRHAVRPAVAATVAVAVFGGLPLAGYGTQVYPEIPAALVLLAAVASISSPASRTGPAEVRRALGALALLVALPWLSIKYVPVAAVAGVALALRLRRRPALLVAVFGLAAVAGVAYLAVHQRIYGGWTPYAAGDHFATTGELAVVGTDVDLLGRTRRLAGLLVDRRFGLVPWSPVWILLPLATGAAVVRRDLRLPLVLVAVTWLNATFVALTMHGWWVPGRQLVVALPLAGLLLACWTDAPAARLRVVVALGAVGIVNWLWLAIEATTGRRTLVVDFADAVAPGFRLVGPLLPDGQLVDSAETLLLVAWSATLVAAAWVGWQRDDVAARVRGQAARCSGSSLRSGPGSSPSDRATATARSR